MLIVQLLISFSISFAAPIAPLPTADREVLAIENSIRPVVNRLLSLGAESVFLAGGSARAYLDHVFEGTRIKMRDIDLLVVLPGVNLAEATRLGKILSKDPNLKMKFKTAAASPRGNPNLPVPERYQYVPAFYVGLESDSVSPWDITFYFNVADIEFSGLLSSDMIRIPLNDRSLVSLQNEVSKSGYDLAVTNGNVIDPNNGYREWRSGAMRIINWVDIEGDPTFAAVRILRMYLQRGALDLPSHLKARLKILIGQQKRMYRLSTDMEFGRERVQRVIQKILKDSFAPLALKRMAELGVIGKWSIEVESILLQFSIAEISGLFRNSPEESWALMQKWHSKQNLVPCRQIAL